MNSTKNKLKMINKIQLEVIGYTVKSELFNNSLDLRIESDIYPNLVNLFDGKIQIINSSNSNSEQKIFDDIETFKQYFEN